jgi:hypothetical protein
MIKKVLYSKTAQRVGAVTATAAVGLATTTHAATGIDPAVVTSSVQSAVTDTIGMMSSLLPIALTIFAATWGVRKAIRFFKGAAN